jgi:glycogen debranching enzyme
VPELWAGLQRGEADFPVQYVGANVPQAWAAGSAFSMLQALLGLEPDAVGGRLHVSPHLPEWLRDVELTGLEFAGQRFDLRFWREGEESRCEVVSGDAAMVVVVG